MALTCPAFEQRTGQPGLPSRLHNALRLHRIGAQMEETFTLGEARQKKGRQRDMETQAGISRGRGVRVCACVSRSSMVFALTEIGGSRLRRPATQLQNQANCQSNSQDGAKTMIASEITVFTHQSHSRTHTCAHTHARTE